MGKTKMNIKKQTGLLYLYEALVCFRMVDVVWVLFLLDRGYSLTQVGIAEGIYHVTSMICEVPSGMAADLFGRKRSLILSGVAGMVSGVLMSLDGFIGWIYLGMIFSALSLNLISGTEEALTYDSLLEAGCEGEFKKVKSGMSVLGRVFSAISCTLSPVAIALGYRYTYWLTVIVNGCGILTVLGLKEPVVTETQKERTEDSFRKTGTRMKKHIRETFVFIVRHPRTMAKVFAGAAAACPCYLTMMYLQEHLVNCGWPKSWIGIPMLLIPLSGAFGAWLAGKCHGRLFYTMLVCGILGGLGTCLAGSLLLGVAVAGACVVRICEGFSEIMVSENVNRDFTSNQRATLVSVDSLFYSVLMVIASPVTGYLGAHYSMQMMFLVLGGVMLVSAVLLGILYRWRQAVLSLPFLR